MAGGGLLLLETDPYRGLTEADAAGRLARFGPNLLPQAGPLGRLLREFQQSSPRRPRKQQ